MSAIEFDVTAQRPSLEQYYRGPGAGVGLADIWPGATVSYASSQTYWATRGMDGFITGTTRVVSPVCGFRSWPKQLDAEAGHLFDEYATHD